MQSNVKKTVMLHVFWASENTSMHGFASNTQKWPLYYYNPTILIIVLRDATQNSLFITLQVHSTCFGCQPHPSSGVHKTVTTASGTIQLPLSNVAKVGHVGGK